MFKVKNYHKKISLLMIAFIILGFLGCTNTKKVENNKVTPTTVDENVLAPKDDTQGSKEVLSSFLQLQLTDAPADRFQNLTYNSKSVDAKVAPYSVKSNLSNISNLKQFGSFSQDQKSLLTKNSFFVSPSSDEQLFYTYEKNEYLKLPSFITVDSVLQVYHVFFDYSLRTLEQEKLIAAVELLTNNMLVKSIKIYNSISNTEVKAEALKNVAFFGVAQLGLKKALPAEMPDEAKTLARNEYALVEAEVGFEKSPIFGFDLDYSQYRPRGHYTRSEDFMRYFRTMMWYGQVPFGFYIGNDGKKTPDYKLATRALLITSSLFTKSTNGSEGDIQLWNQIYNPTVFYVGKTDDLNIYDLTNAITKVYGTNIDMNNIMDATKMGAFYKEIDKLPEPQIQAEWITVNTPVGKQFRFMGQRYIPDSEILQKLVEPYVRPMPSGLDVVGVLGSERAYDILINDYKVTEKYPEYVDAFKKIKGKFTRTSDEKWRSNMYYGWLWILKSLLLPNGKGYPSFMTNQSWLDKSLNTALGSWSELRHDTILYGKQSGAEMGGDYPPIVKSYVEPNIEMYSRLLWLTQYSRKNLTGMNILPEALENKMIQFEELINFLIRCSEKELRNEELSEEDYTALLVYGGTLEGLTSSMAQDGMRWFEITSETDKNMAVIADVHTVPGSYLETGVGSASHIFVVVPIVGKLYLTRGAIFSYYEFVSKQRLTDEQWQKMIKQKKQPEQPIWTKSFTGGIKSEIPVPKEPFQSPG